MNLHKLIFTENACYKAGRKITVKGIMVHSTGANNPSLKRYVGPDDGLLGKNQYNNHWNQHNPDGREVCVHGFIGKLADGTVATYQTLPWDHRGWHCGSGSKGSGNDTHIGFEICEDGLTDAAYFNAVYQEAVELCAYLCKLYGLTEKNIICHSEGHAQGIASNHGDVMHWFPKHGKNMDTFRAAVKVLLDSGSQGGASTDGYTKIMGTEVATAAQMQSYIQSINPDLAQSVIDMIPLYLSEGAAEGVRGDIAFAQSCLETGNFGFSGSAVTLDQNNFCGMGVTANGMKGNSFDTPQLGIRAQIQHLKAYASKDALKNDLVDPRFNYVTRGSAEYVEWLGQQENPDGKGWAAGAGYGSKILTILKKVVDTAVSIDSDSTEYPEKLTSGYYRVRKTWVDSKSQLGAYRILFNAKAQADKNPGYYVFSNEGVRIYPTTTAAYREYTVVKGDSLWAIAQRLLGDGTRYKEIKTLNSLTSDTIYSGQKLKIPNQ